MYALLFTSHVMRDTLLELFNFLYFMEKGKGETVFCSSTAELYQKALQNKAIQV